MWGDMWRSSWWFFAILRTCHNKPGEGSKHVLLWVFCNASMMTHCIRGLYLFVLRAIHMQH
jgi:hypothetical protein